MDMNTKKEGEECMITCKMLVVCQKWKELVISPRVQHWGYSLHLNLEYFIEFAKTNQACQILNRIGIDILIEPYDQPYVCWVNKEQCQNIKDSGLGTLHPGEPPKANKVLNDLERINEVLILLDGVKKEKNDLIKKEKTKEIKNIKTATKIDDFLKRRHAKK